MSSKDTDTMETIFRGELATPSTPAPAPAPTNTPRVGGDTNAPTVGTSTNDRR